MAIEFIAMQTAAKSLQKRLIGLIAKTILRRFSSAAAVGRMLWQGADLAVG
jgi:hypothetical protein